MPKPKGQSKKKTAEKPETSPVSAQIRKALDDAIKALAKLQAAIDGSRKRRPRSNATAAMKKKRADQNDAKVVQQDRNKY